MLDEQFATRLQELDTAGDIKARNEFITANGGMKRVIALAVRGAGLTAAGKPKKPREPRNKDEPEGFAEWYAVYPRHKSRDDAATAYRRAVKRISPEALMAVTKRYREERAGEDQHFTPYPASWLNDGCWKDEPVGLTLVHTSSAPAKKEDVDVWISRLRIFYGLDPECPKGTWSGKVWGDVRPPLDPRAPLPPGCRVPPEAMAAFTAQAAPRPATG